MSPRAVPLPPDERRRAILDAAIPLARERGYAVSTAEIARAAGIAEGTLFRAFPTKADLFTALVDDLVDPAEDVVALDAIDRGLPLEERVRRAAEQWGARIADVTVVMTALYASGGGAHLKQRPGAHGHHSEQSARLNDAVARLLEPDRDRLRVPPDAAAAFIRAAIFSARHPMLHDGPSLTTDQLVALLVHGILEESSCS